MKIKRLLLDQNNPLPYHDRLIGSNILKNEKQYLWSERVSNNIDVIVVHYISATKITPDTPYNLAEILNIFVIYGVSSHYLISREGDIFLLVPEEKKAWHCGGSIMPDPDCRKNVNEFSLGIELMGTLESGFTEEQYKSLVILCNDIERRYAKRFHYVGHEQIAGVEAVSMRLRNDIKTDPGPLFDWSRLNREMDVARSQINGEHCAEVQHVSY